MNKNFLAIGGVALWLSLPVAGQSLEGDFRKEGLHVRASYDEVTENFQTGSAVIYDDWQPNGYGVIVSEDGLVLVKTSELEPIEKLSLVIGKKKYREVEVVASSPDWDVSLLKVDAEGLEPVRFSESEPSHGTIVLSNGATSRLRRRAQIGVIAANARAVGTGSLAVLGISMVRDEEGPLLVTKISPQSGAKDGGMELKDEIVSIDGTEVKVADEVPELLADKGPGDTVQIVVRRFEKVEGSEVVEDPFDFVEKMEPVEKELQVELRERQEVFPEQLSRNDQMSGEFSKRRSHFPRVIQHDTSLAQRTTGGPLLTLDGKCVGMNIAYASRECSYAIPAKELQELIVELREEAGL